MSESCGLSLFSDLYNDLQYRGGESRTQARQGGQLGVRMATWQLLGVQLEACQQPEMVLVTGVQPHSTISQRFGQLYRCAVLQKQWWLITWQNPIPGASAVQL